MLESDGEVVLTLSQHPGGSGRLRYSTADGTCVPPPRAGDAFEGFREQPPCEPEARAPADYGAVDGVFDGTTRSKTIRIPIVDDDLSEGTEAFTVYAWGEPNGYNTDPYGGPSVIVRIDDDDSDDSGKPAASTATTTTAAGSQPSSSAPVLTVPTAPSPDEHAPAPDLAVAVPSAELRPGQGFELTSEEPRGPAAGRGGERDGSASWLALGLGTAAAAVGAVALLRRRKQWSPTRP